MTPTEQLLAQLERAITDALTQAFAPMHARLDLIAQNLEASTARKRTLLAELRQLTAELRRLTEKLRARDPSSPSPTQLRKPS